MNQHKRVNYWKLIREIPVSDLVFLDETGVNLAMQAAYARSPKGHRAYSQKPAKKGKNVSMIGAITLTMGWIAGFSFEGGTTADIFLWFIEDVLAPQLWPGAVVVMDNLPAHKVEGVRVALSAAGARLNYLSPYSPDFNPIENLWSKLKSYLKSAEARTFDIAVCNLIKYSSESQSFEKATSSVLDEPENRYTLHDAIRDGLNLVSLQDIHNWSAHCCYCA